MLSNSARTDIILLASSFNPIPPRSMPLICLSLPVSMFMVSAVPPPSCRNNAYSSRSFFTDSLAVACSCVSPNSAAFSSSSAFFAAFHSASLSSAIIGDVLAAERYASPKRLTSAAISLTTAFCAIIFSVKSLTPCDAANIFCLKSVSIAADASAILPVTVPNSLEVCCNLLFSLLKDVGS